MAILSFPAVTQCATTVQELVQNAEMQSAVMRRIKEEFPLQEALVSMMDLSVEAQAFGCPVSFHEGEIPAVTSGIIKNREDGEALRIPKMEEGRMSVYLAGVENIVFCCNRSTADHIISSPLFMDPDYERIHPDYSSYTKRFQDKPVVTEAVEAVDRRKKRRK